MHGHVVWDVEIVASCARGPGGWCQLDSRFHYPCCRCPYHCHHYHQENGNVQIELNLAKFNAIIGHYDFAGHGTVIMYITGIPLITRTSSCWDVI